VVGSGTTAIEKLPRVNPLMLPAPVPAVAGVGIWLPSPLVKGPATTDWPTNPVDPGVPNDVSKAEYVVPKLADHPRIKNSADEPVPKPVTAVLKLASPVELKKRPADVLVPVAPKVHEDPFAALKMKLLPRPASVVGVVAAGDNAFVEPPTAVAVVE
jgi:hypothetical protein